MALNNQDIQDITQYIQDNSARIRTNAKLFDIYEGDLLRFVRDALRHELHRQSFEQAVSRISPINIDKRLVNKLSKLYTNPPERRANNRRDQQILEYYEKNMNIDSIFHDCNIFYNNHKYCLLQPYLDPKTGTPKARSIPASRFLVRSVDRLDPSRPTEVILFMGQNGNSYEYWIYTDEELVKILDDGQVISRDENPYGRIPFVYINKTRHDIMPAPDEDLLQMSILIPVLLTDVNYATKFQAFSIIYGVDLDMDNMTLGPNNVWSFKSDPEKNIKPEVDILSPKADVQGMMASIEAQLSMFFESRNLKRSGRGRAGVETAQSGIALMIQNLDVTDDIREQRVKFQEAESELWDLIINYLHPVWVSQFKDMKLNFSQGAEVEVEFPEIKAISSEDEVLEREILKLDNNLTTRRMSLSKLYPAKSQKVIDEMLKEIEAENGQGFRLPDAIVNEIPGEINGQTDEEPINQ